MSWLAKDLLGMLGKCADTPDQGALGVSNCVSPSRPFCEQLQMRFNKGSAKGINFLEGIASLYGYGAYLESTLPIRGMVYAARPMSDGCFFAV